MDLLIATPSFGRTNYLIEAIDSVKNQSVKVRHVVCLGEKFPYDSDIYKGVDFITIEPDPGMVECWNKAATYHDSKYISFLADDNMLEREFSAKMIKFMEDNPDCDLAFCNQTFFSNEKSLMAPNYDPNKFFGRDLLPNGIIGHRYLLSMLKLNSIPLEACILKRNLWNKHGPFNLSMKGAFDFYFLYRIMLDPSVQIGFIPDNLMKFRIHSLSYSSTKKKEHLLGKIAALVELKKYTNPEYIGLINNMYTQTCGVALRTSSTVQESLKFIKILLSQKNGVYIITKNLLAKMFRIGLSKT